MDSNSLHMSVEWYTLHYNYKENGKRKRVLYISVARYYYAKLLYVPCRTRATVYVTSTHCHCSRACGRGFKMAEVVSCDKLELQLFLVCMTSAAYIFMFI